MKWKQGLFLIPLLLGSMLALKGHVVKERDPQWDALANEELPDLATARQQVAFAMGYDYGQRFRTQNNAAKLPLEAFIKGLRSAANNEHSTVDEQSLRKALYALEQETQKIDPEEGTQSHQHD
jgi:hypothetical protein